MIKKAVILAAGLGKRFGPITKAVPKPMLPIGNRPVLDYIVDELKQSGIEQILIVVGHKKEIIMDYFSDRADIQFIVQGQLNGTASAILLAEGFIKDEPFAICLSDEVVESPIPCIQQLIDIFQQNKTSSMVMGLEKTTEAEIRAYNSVEVMQVNEQLFQLLSTVEKPQGSYPSLYTSIGRYVAAPSLFDYLKLLKQEEGRELYSTDAFNLMMKESLVLGLYFSGKRWDIGTKEGWLAANTRLG